MKKLRDLMTRDVEVARPEDTLRDCAEKMRSLNVGSLPVLDGQRLTGMITDRDIVVRAIAMGHNPETSRVRDAMSPEVFALNESASLREAAEMMKEHQVRRLPVVDDNQRLIGIIALGDLAQEASDRISGETLEAISEPTSPSI